MVKFCPGRFGVFSTVIKRLRSNLTNLVYFQQLLKRYILVWKILFSFNGYYIVTLRSSRFVLFSIAMKRLRSVLAYFLTLIKRLRPDLDDFVYFQHLLNVYVLIWPIWRIFNTY